MTPIKPSPIPAMPVSGAGLLQGLHSLANLQLDKGELHVVSLTTQRDKNGKILSFSVNHSFSNKNLLSKVILVVKRIFFSHVDDLKELKEIYETVLEHISSSSMDPIERAKWQQTIENSFKQLKQLYEINRNSHSLQTMAYKMDILEAISVAVKDNGLNAQFGTNISRIKADTLDKQQKMLPTRVVRHLTPLIRMEHVEQVAALIKRDFPSSPPTLQQLLDHPEIRPYLLVERVAAGRLVRQLYKYRHKTIVERIHNVIAEKLTAIIGERARRVMQPGRARTRAILQFFKETNISLETVVPSGNGQKELYAYSEVFTNALRSEVSVDAAFQRLMTDESRALFLREANQASKKQQNPIISTAFCRLRIIELPPNQANQRISIQGKQLANSDPTKGFSIKNILGFEDRVKLAFPEQGITPHHTPAADELYRSCLVSAVDRVPTTMVVQRLAPDDIHHFVQPVDGEILSLSEGCKELRKMLKKSQNPQEQAQLELLIQYYETQKDQRTDVRIQGTQQSVSTLATTQSNPLSQNDRKIQIIRHKTGEISLHIYIGALGVNNIQLTEESGERSQGAEVGAMGFGNDSTEDRTQWPKMATETNSVLLRRTSAGNRGKAGDENGQFHRNGSTVVSIYFNLESSPTMKQAKTIQYKDNPQGEVHQMEILTNLGDVIGYEK